MTTDQMDSITPEERNSLAGYCEHCEEFVPFTKSSSGIPPHSKCGEPFSAAIGLQPTSKRTFDLIRSKKDLAKWKKKVGKK